MRRALAACVCLCASIAGCGWELPAPDIAYEVGAIQRDASPDRGLDAPPPPDVDLFDAPPLDRPDAPSMDLVDASDAGDALDVRDVVDVVDALDVADAADVRDVQLADGQCLPPSFRACFTGDRTTLGAGYCREGAQFCERDGGWSSGCEGEITRDCSNGRVCGSDGCEGSCGRCPDGRICDDTGRCVPPSSTCGPSNFLVPCGRGNCPTNSACVDNRCRCVANFEARHCDNVPCPPTGCDGTDWWCAPAPFCAGGAIVCGAAPSTFLCPRWSLCDVANRACLCRPGFEARRCDGSLCTSCPGTEYECVPTRAPMAM